MRREIPFNNVKHDYICVLNEFISCLKDKLSDELVMVYLTGSYARGDATDSSDLDVFCIFRNINKHILESFVDNFFKKWVDRHFELCYDKGEPRKLASESED